MITNRRERLIEPIISASSIITLSTVIQIDNHLFTRLVDKWYPVPLGHGYTVKRDSARFMATYSKATRLDGYRTFRLQALRRPTLRLGKHQHSPGGPSCLRTAHRL